VITSVIFRSNKVHSMLETHLTKGTVVGESNNAGVWGLPPEANGVRGRSPRRCGDFTDFFFKNTHF